MHFNDSSSGQPQVVPALVQGSCEMLHLTNLALKTLRQVMEDPKASPSVRLKAALAVLNRRKWAATAEPEAEAKVERKAAAPQEFAVKFWDRFLQQSAAATQNTSPVPAETPRNATCPCGSGIKFKRCCGTAAPPQLNIQAQAAA